ncbi:MAG: MBL fold metallo-hydrolase [Candidatus Hatepunaea meridiana]|nr:MBL fold metallo-hydrolase [Candidatus Hatepunaea meridiana]
MNKPRNSLITIGAGAGLAVLGKGGAAHYVEIDDNAFLMDCGEGAAGWLSYLDVLHKIKYIFISHLHSDHISGLFPVIQNMFLAGRKEPLQIFLPEAGIKPLSLMQETVYLANRRPSMFSMSYHPIKKSVLIDCNNFSISAWESDHFKYDIKDYAVDEIEAFGFTINTNGQKLIYTGDVSTIDCFKDELVPSAVLLCEAMHIDTAAIVNVALDIGLKKVIFTHSDPVKSQQLEDYCINCDIAVMAKDGLEFVW